MNQTFSKMPDTNATTLSRAGLIISRSRRWGTGRFGFRGHGVEGVFSLVGRWDDDPSPCLYLTRIGEWDRMANAQAHPMPTTHSELRRLLRMVRSERTTP